MGSQALSVLAACMLAAPSAHAQTDTLAARRIQLLQTVPAGTTLRARTAAATVTGRLVRISADTLFIEQNAVPFARIEDIWLQQRATWTGAKWGGLIGAPIGAALGTFALWLVSALCEYDCNDFGAGDAALGIVGFGAAGLITGGAIGAIVGAATPQWVALTSRRARIPEPDEAAGPIGSITLLPAYARPARGDGGGAGARVAYLFHTPHFSLGPDLGWYSLGTNLRPTFVSCSEGICLDTVPRSERAWHVGGVARVGTGTQRTVEPYGSVGVGVYSWGDDAESQTTLGGYSLGAGVQWRNRTGKRALVVEGRWQSNLSRSGDPDPHFGFYTIGIGGSLAW